MVFSLFPLESFPNESFAFLFSAVFIIVFLFELRILLRQKRSGGRDKNSLIFILIGIFLPLIITILLSYLGIGLIDNRISYLGFILLLFGFALRQYSISILGKFFVPVVSLQKNQRLVEKGPYRYVRHPSYAGHLLELAGFALGLSNWLGFAISLILFIPAISYRIKVEEEFLEKNLLCYKEYKNRTYKLVPYIY